MGTDRINDMQVRFNEIYLLGCLNSIRIGIGSTSQ